MTQDFLISDQTGVWLFEPLTEAARNFVLNCLSFDELLWREQSLVVDYRDAGALAEDLAEEGFSIATRH
jgi:hypothetical protein